MTTPVPDGADGGADARPRTAILHQWVGFGDLVWHVPYFRLVAAASRDGRASLIAPPSTFARDLVGHEPWVREIIDFDRHPRRHERRSGRHRGVLGLLRMGRELRAHGFERMVLFTNHTNRSLVALAAGVPERLGYGTSWLQRRLLTRGPWIERYRGEAVTAYLDATSFAIAQGWCDAPVVPRLVVRPDALARMRERLAPLPQPLVALCLGASEPEKQWGMDRFAALADALARLDRGVLLLGGPAEREMAQALRQRLEPALRERAMVLTDGTIADTVAAMSLASACAGNDTGAAQIAAAVGTPTLVVLGPRPALPHDPLMLGTLVAPRLSDIRPADVLQRLQATPAFAAPAAASHAAPSPDLEAR
jgi:heptosyltransferase-2